MTPARIRAVRKKLGLNADNFAELLGLTGVHRERNVFNWEKGICRPNKQHIEKLLEIEGDINL